MSKEELAAILNRHAIYLPTYDFQYERIALIGSLYESFKYFEGKQENELLKIIHKEIEK